MQGTMRLVRHLKRQIRTQWPDGVACLLVGVSGGADSMCLLQLLRQCAEEKQFCLEAVHVHHGIRGKEADLDRDFVEEQCRELSVDFHVVHVNALELAERDSRSLEDAARELRHAALRKVATQVGADAIVLAHHREDQAETVLFHLLRGAAGDGLCGMWPYRNGLFRPLLDVSARDLRHCLAENHWLWREDATNRDEAYSRNALRHVLLPMVKETLRRDPVGPLTRFAKLQREDQAFLAILGEQAAQKVKLSGTKGNAVFEIPPFSELPSALARRVVLLAWERATGKRTDLELVHIQAICELCTRGQVHAKLDLPEGMQMVRTVEVCHLAVAGKLHTPDIGEVDPWSYPVMLPQADGESIRVVVPEVGGCLHVRRLEEGAGVACPGGCPNQSSLRQTICFEEDREGIYIRNRRPGDRFRPWRGAGGKKLKEWLIDKKIPLRLRGCIPLLARGNQVMWVVGYGTATEPESEGTRMFRYEMVWEEFSPPENGYL